MRYAVSWVLVLVLLATWSASVWLLHSFSVWSLTGVGAMVGPSEQIDRLTIPGWVALWIPAELILALQASVSAVLPWVQSSLSALPSLAGWLAPMAWIVWGVGLLILAVGAAALHITISMTHRAVTP